MAKVMPMYEFRYFSDSKTKEVILPSLPANDQNVDHSYAAAHTAAFLATALLTFAMSIAFSGCGSQAKAFSTTSASNAVLTLNPTSVDFGDVGVGKSASQKVLITNEDSAPVNLALSTSSSAFTIDGAQATISLKSGSSTTVQVHYKPGSDADSTAELNVDATINASTNTVSTAITPTSYTSGTISSSIRLHGKGTKTATLSSLSCASALMTGA